MVDILRISQNDQPGIKKYIIKTNCYNNKTHIIFYTFKGSNIDKKFVMKQYFGKLCVESQKINGIKILSTYIVSNDLVHFYIRN